MKKLLFLGACWWALTGPARAQTAPADLVVVRLYEGSSVTAIITRGAGKSEKVEFPSGVTDRSLTRTAEAYHQLFSRFYQEGYALQATLPATSDPSSSYLTLLFVKGK